ncbi:MAG: hypothetical protein DRG78_09225 [Epsilonproteobacteria bacterium]|nr:MAG: hypothetical protein DRG78_09225 [Campylobacterota bacterium]
MSLPYTLIEKSILRKPGSDRSIGTVLTDGVAWMQQLQDSINVSDFFYYGEVIDGDTKLRYFVYSNEAVAYFNLATNIIEADAVSTGESIVGSGVVSKSDIYSLEEVKTNKFYLGKPVYRKIIEGSFGESGAESGNFLIHNDLEFIVTAKAVTTQVAGLTSSIFGFHSTDTIAYYFIQSTSDNKSVYSAAFHSEWVNQPWTATIEYTKTTDTIQEPEALNIIQSEMPSYSTEEVLTTERWIDGKPIYRKVVSGVSDEINQNTEHNIIDIDNIIDHQIYGRNLKYSYLATSIDGNYTAVNVDEIYITRNLNMPWDCIFKYTKTTDTSESPVAQLSIVGEEALQPTLEESVLSLTNSGFTELLDLSQLDPGPYNFEVYANGGDPQQYWSFRASFVLSITGANNVFYTLPDEVVYYNSTSHMITNPLQLYTKVVDIVDDYGRIALVIKGITDASDITFKIKYKKIW